MITVNLLPEQLRLKKKDFDFPIFPILILGYGVLFVVYLVMQINIASMNQMLQDLDSTLLTVGSKSLEAQRLEGQVGTMQEVIDGVVKEGLSPEYSITLILHAINKHRPEGMWLTEIHFYNEEGVDALRIRGFVLPDPHETMISIIGRFNGAVKEFLEAQQDSGSELSVEEQIAAAAKGVALQKQAVDFTMTSKRRQAEKIEITEFATVFTL